MRVLFICKKNENYDFVSYGQKNSGLYNSTRFIVESLSARGVHAKIVEVIDNNDIDREVHQFKPSVVIIEALWVVPEKYPILMKLHPSVQWFVHLHSHMPFLALEGNSIDWIFRSVDEGVGLIANSATSYDALRAVIAKKDIVMLPNVYLIDDRDPANLDMDQDIVNIGCFGAVRPMKNHLLQALAAIKFARDNRKYLKFHINGSRVETGGRPVLGNLVKLFEHTDNADLVLHPWNEPVDHLDLLSTMDIGMQVSLTETFNVVSADYVTAGIPIVVSKEVYWASRWNKCEDNSVHSIVDVMNRVWGSYWIANWNKRLLQAYSEEAQEKWYHWIRKQEPENE